MKSSQMHMSIGKTLNVNQRGFGKSNLSFLSPVREQEKSSPGDEPSVQPVVTIDDLETLAKQLLAGIERLKSYRHPLALRRGFKDQK
jgi:DNA-binding IclR family transcriptional regulator